MTPTAAGPALRSAAAILLMAVIAVIGWVDVTTGPDLGMSLFYLVPVVVAGWYLGLAPGLVVAGAAAAAWFGSDVVSRGFDTLPISMWNGLTRMVIFLLLGGAAAVLREDRDRLAALAERLRQTLDRESLLARTDPLTGLANSRAFREDLDADRTDSSFGLAYVDLDDFKSINDRFGHAAGDAVLRRVADALRQTVRGNDLVARLGGDEFAIVLRGASPEDVERGMQRVLQRVHEVAADYPGCSLGASIGVACFGGYPGSDRALREADAAMYEAKTAGKHRCVVRRPAS